MANRRRPIVIPPVSRSPNAPVLPAFADQVPYNAIVVRLEEGPYMVSNLVDFAPEELRVDLPVEVTFTDVSDGVALPHFRPLRG